MAIDTALAITKLLSCRGRKKGRLRSHVAREIWQMAKISSHQTESELEWAEGGRRSLVPAQKAPRELDQTKSTRQLICGRYSSPYEL